MAVIEECLKPFKLAADSLLQSSQRQPLESASTTPNGWLPNSSKMNLVTRSILELQETTLIVARAVTGFIKGPRYLSEIVAQMDVIGVGSLTIILLTGFFTGGVLTVQTFPTLAFLGTQGQTGRLVAVSLVRELGPVLDGADGDWARRFGDRRRTRIDDRIAADRCHARAGHRSRSRNWWRRGLSRCWSALPLLTVLADVVGIGGGAFAATSLYGLSINEFLNFRSGRN